MKLVRLCGNSKDPGHFLQKFAHGTASKFNSRKNQKLSAICIHQAIFIKWRFIFFRQNEIRSELSLTSCFYYQAYRNPE